MPPLILRDYLLGPPTWPTSVRDLGLYLNTFHFIDCIVGAENPDPAWKMLKSFGGHDFFPEIVRPGTQDGLWLDTEHNFAPTIVTDRITPENFHHLLPRIVRTIKTM